MVPPHPITSEELMGACDIPPASVYIKFYLVKVSYLLQVRLYIYCRSGENSCIFPGRFIFSIGYI